MQDPKTLKVYGQARELGVAVYRLTASFPDSERFALIQQMRRAAVSVGSNIAEGCGGKGSRALLPYLHHSIASCNELAFQLEHATAVGYCEREEADVIEERIARTRRMLIRFAESVRRQARWE
jgi:four helix bundle protein